MTEQQYEYLKALRLRPGWDMVKEFLQKQIDGLRNDLERTDFQDLNQVVKIQAKLQSYKAVLEYPDSKIKQFESQQERNNLIF